MRKIKKLLALLLCCSTFSIMAGCNANGELDINGILGVLGQSSTLGSSTNGQNSENNENKDSSVYENSSETDDNITQNSSSLKVDNDDDVNADSSGKNDNDTNAPEENSPLEDDLATAVGSRVTEEEWNAAFALLNPEMNVTITNCNLAVSYKFVKNACAGVIENGFFITEEDASYHYFQDDNGNWLRDEISESLVTYHAQLYSRIFQLAGLAYSQLTYDEAKGVYSGSNVVVTMKDDAGNSLGEFSWGTISIEMRKGKVYQIITNTTEIALDKVTFSNYGTTKIEKPTSYGEGKSPHAPEDFVSIN